MKIRIGYDDADTLITYPHAHNLSGCAQPIRVRRARPAGALGWAGTRAAGCRDVISALWPAASRDYLTRPVPASCPCRERLPAVARSQPISVDWWCTMTRRASPDVAGAHTLDSSDAPPSQRTR